MKELIKNLKFTWRYSNGIKSKLCINIFINIIKILVSVLAPIISANIIVNLTSNELNRVLFLAMVLFATMIITYILGYTSEVFFHQIYFSITAKLKKDLGKQILKINNETLDNNSSGVFIKRLTDDTEILSECFSLILDYLEMILGNVGILIAIFIINKIVFIYIVFAITILFLINKKRTNIRNENNKIYYKSREKLMGFIGELVRGTRDIKMLNSEESFSKELDNRIVDNNNIQYKKEITNSNYKFLIFSVKEIFALILIMLFIILLKKDLITITTALIIYNYSGRVSNLIYSVNNFIQSLKDLNLSAERIIEIIDGDSFPKEKFGDKHLEKVEGNFEFKDVTFRYKKGGRKILDNLNFKVKANETVAFVGKTGVGKSTIFSLLCKMYEPNSGKITIDGVDTKELDKDSIRGNITIISQTPYIFNVSIKDNFKLVKEDVTDKEIKEACKLACLDKFINKLPEKYNTIVGEGGVNLSGGEKQRLAIARALVQKTEIILFDEATSALDNETQRSIQKAIDNMKREYTIMIIAHRLSTIINADRILFIDSGKVIAEGTHKELLKTCEEYKELYNSEIKKRK